MFQSGAGRRRLRRAIGIGAGMAIAAAIAPAGASAIDFSQCPLSNPNVGSCFDAQVTGGQFILGNASVPISRTITLRGGVITDFETGATTWVDARDGQSLSRTPLNVPGGLLAIIVPSEIPEPARSALQWAIDNGFTGVTATAEVVRPIGFSFNNYANQSGPAITLPLRVKLDNVFLGGSCYIGSAAQPINLQLTTGTTAPRSPNRPISGSTGTLTFPNDGFVVHGQGFRLVDNAFSAPAANGCGGIFSLIVNPIVNLKEGLPSPAGTNTAIQTGNFDLVDRSLAR